MIPTSRSPEASIHAGEEIVTSRATGHSGFVRCIVRPRGAARSVLGARPMLDTCPSCHGFLPPTGTACPHCDEPIANAGTRSTALGAVGIGLMAVTLMACYAAPYEPPGSCNDPIAITTEYPALGSTDLAAYTGGSCIGMQRSEIVYQYTPDSEVAGRAGTFHVAWSGKSDFGVYLRADCAGEELACAQPSPNGSLAVRVDAIGPMRIFVSGPPLTEDKDEPSDRRSFALTVDFEAESSCGDGVVDPTEECDDGNTVPGDGCDAQCRLDACFFAKPVAVGLTTGDTSLAGNQLASPCSSAPAPVDVYVFTPPERGTVTFSVDAASGLGLVELPNCGGDLLDECAAGPLDMDVLPGAPVYVVVTGNTQPAGPYGLTVDFAPSCGNGTLDLGEGCDDGNRTPGDGCDAACQIEP